VATPEESAEHLMPAPGLFDRLAESARAALTLARREAEQAHSGDIRSEHLLLGLAREGRGIAARALTASGLDLIQLRLESATRRQPATPPSPRPGRQGLTDESKSIIQHAVAEARASRHRHIDTEHLLLGILDEPECAASQFLLARGLSADAIRAQVDLLLGQPKTAAPAASGAKSNVVTCRLDDVTLEAVDSLVEAGIRSSRSDAVTWLVAAGIEGHRPLFDRIRATVTAIRQLRAEASDIAGGGPPKARNAGEAHPPGEGPAGPVPPPAGHEGEQE
jgi:hypothetical protein